MPPHPSAQKNQTTNIVENMEKEEPLFTVGVGAN